MASSSRTPSPTAQEPESTAGVYSLSDQTISQELDFVEEIGNGNWGSVWLVRPKRSRPHSEHVAFKDAGRKFAVKLVHRKKTAANASRIKSLWNEMKIVRAFKDDKHPSIISFHSFIMTPSFAMISMTYLPTLIPVEVDEDKCREWFHFLLSGVDFLHRRGVVHNDIKPANILLSHKNIPVLVDFGFAELKDLEDATSFHSNLTYGTPEYLSPERARGITHDTRKSDVWSLGVTFFEILSGRTPFEEYDGDTLQTKEDVEKYWSRTLRGKWVGKWSFTDKMEKLLRRMMSPNADLRCTAAQAMADGYWKPNRESQSHRRSSSYTSSVAFEKDLDRLLNMTPPPSRTEVVPQANPVSPPGLDVHMHEPSTRHALMKSKSQPKVAAAAKLQPRKRVPQVLDLSPIKGSPPTTPNHRSASAKENAVSSNLNPNKENEAVKTRRPFGAVLSPESNAAQSVISRIPVKRLDEMTSKRRSGILGDLRRSHSNLANEAAAPAAKKTSNNVKDRVMEWEREKQRLREMERLAELERERDDHFERRREAKKEQARKSEEEQIEQATTESPLVIEKDRQPVFTEERRNTKTSKKVSKGNKENVASDDKENSAPSQRQSRPSSPPTLPLPPVMSPLSRMMNILPAPTPNNTPAQAAGVPAKQSKQNIFKHSLKASIDKTLQFYKSSSIGRAASGSTPARGISFEIAREAEMVERNTSLQRRFGSQIPTEASTPGGSSSVSPAVSSPFSPLAPIKNAAMTEQMAADTQMDRMAIWMKNVEKVVEEAQANFEASAPRDYKLPPMPLPPPQSSHIRAQRSSRLPRRLLAASQIFDESGAPSPIDSSFASNAPPSSFSGAAPSNRGSSSAGHEQPPSGVTSPNESQFVIPEIVTPSRRRRATVSDGSPSAAAGKMAEAEALNDVKFKHRPAHASLAQLRIAPLAMLDADNNLNPQPSPRLAEVVDRNLFIAPPYASRDNLLDSPGFGLSKDSSCEDLNSSICHVEPYPLRARPSGEQQPYVDTPGRMKLEGVYDRFLMSSGVKRFGKGYQSETLLPVSTAAPFGGSSGYGKKESHRAFYSAKKPMPPPVSSADIESGAVAVDELGIITNVAAPGDGGDDMEARGITPIVKEEGNSTVALVRRAFKAMVPGKTVVSRRVSRAY